MAADCDGGAIVEDGRSFSRALVPLLNTFLRAALRTGDQAFQWNAWCVETGRACNQSPEEPRIGLQALCVIGGSGPAMIEWSDGQSESEADVSQELLIFGAERSWRLAPSALAGHRFLITAFQHPAREHLDAGPAGFLKALGFVLDDPAAWTCPVRVGMDQERGRSAPAIYVGRHGAAQGLPTSPWRLPYSYNMVGGRAAALARYRQRLQEDESLKSGLHLLEGRRLACHCGPTQACHADLIVEAFGDLRRQLTTSPVAPTPTDREALAEAARRRTTAAVPLAKKLAGRQAPTKTWGRGDPVFVGRGARRRLLADGGGPLLPGSVAPRRAVPARGPGSYTTCPPRPGAPPLLRRKARRS